MSIPPAATLRVARRGGFTLVELLTVVVIMAIVMVLLALSLGRSQANNVQAAAGQVASGFNLARQIAVGKNTEARVVIATSTNAQGLPEEPFRYWAIISSNKTVTNVWVMEKDWEALPTGVVFLNLATRDYNTIEWDIIPTNVIGTTLPSPTYGHTGAGKEYLGFSSFGGAKLSYPDAPDNAVHNLPAQTPYIGYRPTGGAVFSATGAVGKQRLAGLRLAQGTVDGAGKIVLQSDRNATVVETDAAIGKVVVRPRESYRE
jgi:prepilin-type N-terminal cleavage/methylation domain-containing protein